MRASMMLRRAARSSGPSSAMSASWSPRAFSGVWRGRCPFHADEGRSLLVDVAENVWRCRGGCATGGSVIEWVMRSEGVSQRHAVEFLRAGMASVGSGRPPRQGTVRRLESPLSGRVSAFKKFPS